MHIVLAYRYYNDGIVYYNLTFFSKIHPIHMDKIRAQ